MLKALYKMRFFSVDYLKLSQKNVILQPILDFAINSARNSSPDFSLIREVCSALRQTQGLSEPSRFIIRISEGRIF